jgi:hypothetical protein
VGYGGLGPGVAEARDHVVPAFFLDGVRSGPGVRPLVIEGHSRRRDPGGGRGRGMKPALGVDREAELGVIGLTVTKLGARFDGFRVVGTTGAEWEPEGFVPVLARGSAFFRIIAGHDGTPLS